MNTVHENVLIDRQLVDDVITRMTYREHSFLSHISIAIGQRGLVSPTKDCGLAAKLDEVLLVVHSSANKPLV